MADDATLTTLRELGFWFATDAVGIPDPVLRLELAIREFQRYAAGPKVARVVAGAKGPYADTLEAIDNPQLFTDPPHGTLDDETDGLIKRWTKDYLRCPVVVEAWWTAWTKILNPADPKGKKLKWHTRGRIFEDPEAKNLWLYDQGKRIHGQTSKNKPAIAAEQRVRMYAIDRSGWLEGNAVFDGLAAEDHGRILIGHQELKKTDGTLIDGPVASPSGGDVRFPVTPDALLGKPYDKFTDAEKVTYRIVRGIAEVECFGFLDSLTCADVAVTSLGLCHWTLEHFNDKKLQRGELEALFAYLKLARPSAFAAALERFGHQPTDAWYPKTGDRTALGNSDQRKFESTFQEFFWDATALEAKPRQMRHAFPGDVARFDMLRSWHWMYRFQMTLRALDMALAMWDMIRFRIRDIMALPVPVSLGITPNETAKPLVLLDLFRSEQTIVLLLESHVLSPGSVVVDGALSEGLIKAIKDAGAKGVAFKQAPKTWDKSVEVTFKDAILAAIRPQKLRPKLKTRFETACRTPLKLEPHPKTKETRLSLIRAAADFDFFDDASLYPPRGISVERDRHRAAARGLRRPALPARTRSRD